MSKFYQGQLYACKISFSVSIIFWHDCSFFFGSFIDECALEYIKIFSFHFYIPVMDTNVIRL